MQLILQGKIITPIISKRTKFNLNRFKARIIKPRRRYFSKITTNKPMFPFSYICYLGDIELQQNCKTIVSAKRKLKSILKIKSIGRFSSEGMGRIQWNQGYIKKSNTPIQIEKKVLKLKIRKGLPNQLSKEVQRLIRYSLLHDFFQTPRHQSKIYIEPELDDLEFRKLLKDHHETTEDTMIQIFQYYDRLAAQITRQIRSPRTNRYNWYANHTIDFQKIAQEITEVAQHPWKLYEYIYQSKEMAHLNESLLHGHTSLRNHLLIIANLIVQDFQKNRLGRFMHNTRD